MRYFSYVFILPLVFSLGCTTEGESGGGGDDVDAGQFSPDAGNETCSRGTLSPSWIMDMEIEVVAKLSGNQEIAPGVSLSDRSTFGNRESARDFLQTELEALGYEVDRHDYGSGINLVATAQGSGSGHYVIGAHYDSVPGSPGANDNATGVAAVLATARYVKELDCPLANGVRFVFFDEEELGLVGARAYALKLEAEAAEILGVFTIDQMGWDMDGDRAIEIEIPGVGMLQKVADANTSFGHNLLVHTTNTAGSDHTAFRERGYLAAGITEEYINGDTTPHYHLPGDGYATVNFDYLVSTTSFLHSLVFSLTTITP